jgi:hypothetical protein
MADQSPRPLRNNNPFDIRITVPPTPWQGLAADMNPAQQAETAFCVFKTPAFGFRAAAVVLISYKDKHAIQTIRGVISRLAPPSENDTGAYIAHVCSMTKMGPDDVIDLHTYEVQQPLIKAIATHEAGSWLWDDKDLDTGLTMAGIQPPVAALAKSRTMKTSTAAIGAGAVIEGIQQIQPVLGTLSQIKDISVHVAVGILVIVAVAVMVFRIQDFLRARR